MPSMSNVVQHDHAAKNACRLCGQEITGPAFARGTDSYCCEGCFLTQPAYQSLRAEHDRAYLELTEALAAALDAREHETGLHSKRVACHTLVLARRFESEPDRLRQVYSGALLHDLGKIGMPDALLHKPGPLTEAEWAVMREHPVIGHRILAGVGSMAEAAEIVLAHEERYDGTGYPRGLKGEAIPLWARLFAIIDTLDAMTSDRPYRRGMSFDAARREIIAASGTQFDPVAVDAFIAEEARLRTMVDLKCGDASLPEGMGSG